MPRTAFPATTAASLLFLFFLSSSLLCAQSGPPQHPPRPILLGPAKWNPSPQEVSASYWTLEPGWNTELEMRNNLRYWELTITPVLRSAAGQELPLAPVTVAPQHVVSLDLRSLAQSNPKILNYIGSFGSVVFRFNGLDAANLFAASMIRREGQPFEFHFDADDAGTSIYKSGGLEGMWWLPAQTSTAYLILSNPSSKTVAGSLVLSSASANRRILLSVGPGQTNRIDIRQALGASTQGPSNQGTMGGLTVSMPGNESLSATQIVFDEVTGLAAIVKLFDREPEDQPKNHRLLAPMMALSQPDPALGFPNGTKLNPVIFLRNATPAAMQVSLTFDWRSESKSGEFAPPLLALAPGEIKILNLADFQQSGQIPADAAWGTVKLGYAGRRADLVAVTISYDKTSRYGLQTPFSESVSRMWAGGMWHVDPTHNTFITTGNAGSEPTAAEVTLFYNGGKSKYRLEKMLSPSQQLWLDLGHLIRDQVPDSDGHTLPPDTMAGSYELRDLDHAAVGLLYEGKLVIDKTYGHAAYGCGDCCGLTIPTLIPDPFGGPPDIDYDEDMQSTEQCGGQLVNIAGDATDWNSSDTAVATLPNSTLHTVAVGSATGNATVTVQATHPAPRCPQITYYPSQPVNVQMPTITSFDPNPIMIGVSNTTLTINGSGFGTSPTVNLPAGITSTGQGSTDTQIILQGVSVALSATVGNNNVTVTAGSQTSAPASLTVDGPYQMVVQSDILGHCSGCQTTVERNITYQINNFSGTPAQNIWIGEVVSTNGWSCTQQQPATTTTPCSANDTKANGLFTDSWYMGSDSYTPVGCGFNVSYDNWQWCAHTPAQTLGSLQGYIHTNAVSENGVVSPPNSFPTGTVIPF
jgi:hypothetical protein